MEEKSQGELQAPTTMTMADDVKIPIEEEHPVSVVETTVPTGKDPRQASSSSSVETETAAEETERPASGTPATKGQDETSSAGTGDEQRGTAEGERNIQFGAVVAVLSFAVMLPGLSFSSALPKGPDNWRLDILMLLAFASCICGLSFMLLSMQLLGAAPEIRGFYHWAISRCLFYACIALPALTLLSLLLVMPFKLYLYVGLAVPPLAAVAVAAVHWYANSRSDGATEPPDGDDAAESTEQAEEMEASSKITGALMASSFGGLVGTLGALDKQQQPGDAAGDDDTLRATHVAIMFMFSTAVMSVLLMVLSMVALKIESRLRRRSLVGAIGHANVILLGLLAVAAFSAAFVVLRFYVLTAFISLALAALVQFIIQHFAAAKKGAGDGNEQGKAREKLDRQDVQPADPDPIQEKQLGWMADIGKQVTAWSLGGVMVIFGRFIGDSDRNHGKTAANKTCMFLLTSAFASGLGLMFLMSFRSGGPARGGFNAATNILACAALGTITAAALAIYGVVVMKS
ncbi:uncharacterized protein LOC120703692 isoform X1 [Panicum virgatum]|nr:uncharacterized protein LOC120703692 isoform X1 [Panicum virgatum]